MLEFRVLGPLEVFRDGEAVGLPGVASRRVLAGLALRAGAWVSVDRLIDELWAERPPGAARKALQMHVSRLRRALGEDADVLVAGPSAYRLAVAPEQIDARRFEGLVAEGRAATDPQAARELLLDALSSWRGRALEELAMSGPAAAEIARLEELRIGALEQRIDADMKLGRAAELVGELGQLVEEHPYRERLRAQLMLALYRSGRQSEALDAYRRARAAFVDELGIEPGPELRELERAVLAQDAALNAPPAAVERDATALPAAATACFGRAADVARIADLLIDARLLTLVGPGGVGKTRLAIEAARAVAERFAAGVRVAWLAGVPDVDGVAAAVGAAADAHPIAGETFDAALVRRLADLPLLLVIDNMEHVLPAAPLIASLVARCPRLTVLATSREPLRLTAERCLPVSPLAIDDAAELFTDRARARRLDVALDADAVARICQQLDGLPLAIELAAGRVELLAPSQLVERLADALPLLADGPRDLVARQQTMRATLDWSYDLLTHEEQRAFAALGAFTGGSTLEAAEVVTAAPLTVLHSLVSRNLAYVSDGRIGLLEVIRQYASQRLDASPEQVAVRDRHAYWYLDHAVRSEREVLILRARGRAQLAKDQGNFTAALSWAVERRDAVLAQRLVGALTSSWLVLQRRDEGVRWADGALALGTEVPARVRGRALLARAQLRWHQAGERTADTNAALGLLRGVGDDAGVLSALCILAEWAAADNDRVRAREYAREAREVGARLGDPYDTGRALKMSAIAADSLAEARTFADLAAAQLRPLGAFSDIAYMRSVTGWLGMLWTDYAYAERELAEAMEACQADDSDMTCMALGNLGIAVLFQERTAEAAMHFRRQLTVSIEHRLTPYYCEALLGLAAIAAEDGDDIHAATLYGGFRATEDRPPNAVEAVVYNRLEERFLDPARERLGRTAWAAAETDGYTRAGPDGRSLLEPDPSDVPRAQAM